MEEISKKGEYVKITSLNGISEQYLNQTLSELDKNISYVPSIENKDFNDYITSNNKPIKGITNLNNLNLNLISKEIPKITTLEGAENMLIHIIRKSALRTNIKNFEVSEITEENNPINIMEEGELLRYFEYVIAPNLISSNVLYKDYEKEKYINQKELLFFIQKYSEFINKNMVDENKLENIKKIFLNLFNINSEDKKFKTSFSNIYTLILNQTIIKLEKENKMPTNQELQESLNKVIPNISFQNFLNYEDSTIALNKIPNMQNDNLTLSN